LIKRRRVREKGREKVRVRGLVCGIQSEVVNRGWRVV